MLVSVKQMALVWDLDLPSTEKLVLLKLADCADDAGANAYPGVQTLGDCCGLSRRAVQYVLRKLEEAGLIEVQKRAVFDHSTVYRIHTERGAKIAPLDIGGANDDVGGRNLRHEGAHDVRPIRPDPSMIHPVQKKSTLTPEWLQGEWNARRGKLDECRELTPVLRQNARMRLKELRDAEAWLEVIGTIAASAFCNGENDRSWRSDFAHLVQRGTWEKARAGKYANRAPRTGGDIRQRTRDANVKQVAGQGMYIPTDDDDTPHDAAPVAH